MSDREFKDALYEQFARIGHALSTPKRLGDSAGWRLWAALRDLGQLRLTEIAELLRSLSVDEGLELVDRPTLWRLAQDGQVSVLDVRPAADYDAGHIPGALSIPIEDLERRLSEVPVDQPVVAYCRGPYCVLDVPAVEVVRRHGFAANRLAAGFPEWREEGPPGEAGGGA